MVTRQLPTGSAGCSSRSDPRPFIQAECQRPGHSWLPILLLSLHAPTADELAAVAALARETARGERLGFAAVLPYSGTGGVPLDIDADGILHTPGIDDGLWRAVSMAGDTAAGLAAILGPTLDPAGPPVRPPKTRDKR